MLKRGSWFDNGRQIKLVVTRCTLISLYVELFLIETAVFPRSISMFDVLVTQKKDHFPYLISTHAALTINRMRLNCTSAHVGIGSTLLASQKHGFPQNMIVFKFQAVTTNLYFAPPSLTLSLSLSALLIIFLSLLFQDLL